MANFCNYKLFISQVLSLQLTVLPIADCIRPPSASAVHVHDYMMWFITYGHLYDNATCHLCKLATP